MAKEISQIAKETEEAHWMKHQEHRGQSKQDSPGMLAQYCFDSLQLRGVTALVDDWPVRKFFTNITS